MLDSGFIRSFSFTIAVLLAAGFCMLVFWPGLSGDFIFDDHRNIVQNVNIHISEISVSELEKAASAYPFGPLNRPLSTVSFALNYFFTGLDPFYFKLTNLVIHTINLLLIFLLVRTLLRSLQPRQLKQHQNWLALLVALAWAIHPLQVSTVLYAVQRMEILAVTFTLFSLLAYATARHSQIEGLRSSFFWFILFVCFTLAAVLSKENGALAPVYALCIELTVFKFAAKREGARRRLKFLFNLFLVTGICLFAVVVVPEYATVERYLGRDFNWHERLLSQLRVLTLYLSWVVFPDPNRMLFFYDHFAPSRGLFQPATTLLGGLFLACLLSVGLLCRKHWPLVSLGVFLFFTAHLLTSNIFPLELAFEHRNYFAVFGMVLAGAGLANALAEKGHSIPLTLISLILLLGLGGITALRSDTWGEPMRLARSLAAINPESQRTQTDLAFLYRERSAGDHASPMYAQAIETLERAAALPRASPIPEQALILMSAEAGIRPKPEWWAGFLSKLANGPVSPVYRTAVQNLVRNRFRGVAISDEKLIDVHSILLMREGVRPRIHAEFGFYFAEITHSRDHALEAFDRALELLEQNGDQKRGLLMSINQSGHTGISEALAKRHEIELKM